MKYKIKNGLPQLCKKHGMKTASDFARAMSKSGYEISATHASRYFKEEIPNPTVAFLECVCNLFDCTVDEILVRESVESSINIDNVLASPGKELGGKCEKGSEDGPTFGKYFSFSGISGLMQ